jgi:hypothetical protein
VTEGVAVFDLPAPHDVSDSVRAAVRGVLDALLEPGELDDWSIGWEQDRDGAWRLVVDVRAGGESHRGFVHEWGARYPVEAGLDVFTDGFEDFISESRFGWGQQRGLRPRPWECA